MNTLTRKTDIRELTLDDLAAVAAGLANDRVDGLNPPAGMGLVWHGPIVLSNPHPIRLIGPTV